MRICYFEINPEPDVPIGLRIALEKLLEAIARPDTDVEVRFPERKLGDGVVGSSSFNAEYVACIKRLEHEGFDGVVMGCFADPGLFEAKRACSIPVTAPAESSLLLAHLFGSRYAIVAFPAPATRYRMERHIDQYGFRTKAIVDPVRFVAFPESDLWRIGEGMDATPMLDSFRETTIRAVQDGAEVIIPGCTATSLIHDRLLQIMDEIGVPVLNPPQAGLKAIEMLVDFEGKLGFHISRIGTFAGRNQEW
jgi:Asp/Glu/hydantoin racemase